MEGPFCSQCGQYMEQLPSRGMAAPELGCRDLSCSGVHPYFVAQALQATREALEKAVEQLASRMEGKGQ